MTLSEKFKVSYIPEMWITPKQFNDLMTYLTQS